MVKIAVSGACGRMGRRIIHLALRNKEMEVVFGLEQRAHPELGNAVEGVPVTGDVAKIKECDCLIEFSTPEATLAHLSSAVKFNRPMVIGTTGFSGDELATIKGFAAKIAVVCAPNMSVGVNLLFKLLKTAAEALGGYRVSVEEAHHVHKKDAPSGTAKKIAHIINEHGFNIRVEDIKAIRENEIVGDHKVVFESEVDKVEFFHSAKTRDIFAQGAVRAGQWIVNKAPGLYSMDDVLFGR
jgi:4-hydroxy-tetrahydrodipicolinate reductase